MYAIGEECHTAHYDWSGTDRPDNNTLLFQYTLSGSGMLSTGGKEMTLNKNEAFLVNIPSEHRYYLPVDSDHWHFLYLTLAGDFATQFTQRSSIASPVFKIPEDSAVIHQLNMMLALAKNGQFTSLFQASTESYHFLMNLQAYLSDLSHHTLPPAIEQAIAFMTAHFNEDLDVMSISQTSGLSTYHFSRLFKETTGCTPIDYLTDIRLRHACERLANTNETIHTIARATGYQNGNYFSKVFKKQFGTTPSLYRKDKQRFFERTWTIL